MRTPSSNETPNLLWHWLRKDFMALRGWFVAWAVLLVTHCVLRLVQLYEGDYVLPEIFLCTHRPDHILQWGLLINMVPMLIQQDSPAGPNFWNTPPINPSVLLIEKALMLVGWFVVLPLSLDFIYFGLAGFQGSDFWNAVGRWGIGRLLVVAILASVACHSKSQGWFLVHFTVVLTIGMLSFIGIQFLNEKISVKFIGSSRFDLHGFWQTLWLPSGLVLVATTLILFLRYVKRTGGGVSLSIVGITTVSYPVLCLCITYSQRSGTDLSIIPQSPPLPDDPASIIIHCKLDADRFSSRGGGQTSQVPGSSTRLALTVSSLGPIQEIMVEGLLQRQNRAAELKEVPTSGPDPKLRAFAGNSGSISQYSYSDEAEFQSLSTTHYFWASFEASAGLPDQASKEGILVKLSCSIEQPTIVVEHPLGAEKHAVFHNKIISLERHPSDKRQPFVVQIVDQRAGIGSKNSSDSRLMEMFGLVGFRQVRDGQIFRFTPSPRTYFEDLTRFLGRASATVSYQHSDEAKLNELHHRIDTNSNAWELLITDPHGFAATWSLPIYLSAKDIQQATGKATDLTLHFNLTTQRWETTSEP